jgi:hypothetical protein
MNPPRASYAATPLAKKLGIAEGSRVVIMEAPNNYTQMLAPIPFGVVFEREITKLTDIVHLFSYRTKLLQAELSTVRNSIKPSAVVWVSWPKKASRLPTDITDNSIRQVALPLGFVDTKVCAVNDIWSGLKLVIRKEYRENSNGAKNG